MNPCPSNDSIANSITWNVHLRKVQLLLHQSSDVYAAGHLNSYNLYQAACDVSPASQI